MGAERSTPVVCPCGSYPSGHFPYVPFGDPQRHPRPRLDRDVVRKFHLRSTWIWASPNVPSTASLNQNCQRNPLPTMRFKLPPKPANTRSERLYDNTWKGLVEHQVRPKCKEITCRHQRLEKNALFCRRSELLRTVLSNAKAIDTGSSEYQNDRQQGWSITHRQAQKNFGQCRHDALGYAPTAFSAAGSGYHNASDGTKFDYGKRSFVFFKNKDRSSAIFCKPGIIQSSNGSSRTGIPIAEVIQEERKGAGVLGAMTQIRC